MVCPEFATCYSQTADYCTQMAKIHSILRDLIATARKMRKRRKKMVRHEPTDNTISCADHSIDGEPTGLQPRDDDGDDDSQDASGYINAEIPKTVHISCSRTIKY